MRETSYKGRQGVSVHFRTKKITVISVISKILIFLARASKPSKNAVNGLYKLLCIFLMGQIFIKFVVKGAEGVRKAVVSLLITLLLLFFQKNQQN